MDVNRAIKRVERYRDDIVTHGLTREAMSTLIEEARRMQLRDYEDAIR